MCRTSNSVLSALRGMLNLANPGRRPRLAMIRRRWRDRILSGHAAVTFQIVQAFVLVLLGDRADLEFWRSQKSLRLAAVSRLQSRASSLRPDEQNDHAGPNQRPVREFAG